MVACMVLQYIPIYSNIFQYIPINSNNSNIFQYILIYSNILQYIPLYSNTFQCNPIYSNLFKYIPIYSQVGTDWMVACMVPRGNMMHCMLKWVSSSCCVLCCCSLSFCCLSLGIKPLFCSLQLLFAIMYFVKWKSVPVVFSAVVIYQIGNMVSIQSCCLPYTLQFSSVIGIEEKNTNTGKLTFIRESPHV